MDNDQAAGVCLISLCGLPGAGKSTAAELLRAHMPSAAGRQLEVSILCFDSYEHRHTCDGDDSFNPEHWKSGRQAALAALAAELRRPLPAGGRRLVVADDTMHYRSMRAECLRLARQSGAAYAQLLLSCPVELALARNAARPAPQRVPADVVHRVAAALEAPDQGNAWEAASASVEAEALGAEGGAAALCSIALALWGPAVPPAPDPEELAARRESAQQATSASALHQADLASRACLAEAAARAAPAQRSQVARQLNEARRRLLERLRAGPGPEEQARLVQEFQCLCGGAASQPP